MRMHFLTRSLSRFRPLLCALAVLLFSTLSAAETGVIQGSVTGDVSDYFLDGATVRLEGTGYRTTTDRSGRYIMRNVPPGEYRLVVSYFGFITESRTLTVTAGSNTADIVLSGDQEELVELEELVVTEEESGSLRALSKQKAADNRIDVVASDDFGQLPDSTIADAVRRLPGINVEQDSQGRAGRYVTIRGMNADFNTVSVNGQKVMVSNFDGASRSVPLDVVPAANAESIEVTKTVLPSQDAASIGGAINIRSRSAFDQKGMAMSFEGSIGQISLASDTTGDYPHDGTPYELAAAWSGRLDSKETIGLALSANVSRSPLLFRSIGNGPYNLDGGDYFPGYGRVEESFDDVEAKGLSGRLDFRPGPNFEVVLDVDYSLRETNQGSNRGQVNYDPAYLIGDLEVSGDTAVAFTSEDRSEREVRDYYEEQENTTVAVQFLHRRDNWEIDYGLGWNRGDFAGDPERDTRAFFRTGFEDGDGNYLANSYELENGDAYSPRYGDNHATLPLSAFELFEVRRGTRMIEDVTLSGFANLKKEMLWGELPGYLKFGAKVTTTDRDFNDVRRRYRTADVDWTLESVVINGDEQVFGSVVADYGVDRAINGQAFGPMIDPAKIRAAENALAEAGIRDEGDANWYLNQNVARDARADLVNSYDLEESVLAGYLEAQVQWKKLTLIAGFRAEATDVTVDTFGGDFFESDPDNPLYIKPIKGENDYVNVLPHLHLRYDVDPDLNLRASINQTLARASFRQLNPSTDIDPTANDDDGIVIKGRTDLDPVVSTNFDLSADKFFSGANRVSIGVFYKSMEDNIYRLTRGVQPDDPDFFPVNAQVSEFLNADGAEVIGIELSFEYYLSSLTDTLRGLSVSGNYTWTDSTVDGIQREDANGDLFFEYGETSLFGQVPTTINLALNYVRWGLETRLAWNWADAYLDFGGIDADRNLDDYIDERSRFDWSIRYRFEMGLSVFLEVRNLLDQDTRAYEGDRSTRMLYREESGRFSSLGVRWDY